MPGCCLNNYKYCCPHCKFISVSAKSFQKHLNGHLARKNFNLAQAPTSMQPHAMRRGSAMDNLQFSFNGEAYSCDACSLKTVNRQFFIQHLDWHDNILLMKCSKCAFTGRTYKVVETHHLNEHKGQKVSILKMDKFEMLDILVDLWRMTRKKTTTNLQKNILSGSKTSASPAKTSQIDQDAKTPDASTINVPDVCEVEKVENQPSAGEEEEAIDPSLIFDENIADEHDFDVKETDDKDEDIVEISQENKEIDIVEVSDDEIKEIEKTKNVSQATVSDANPNRYVRFQFINGLFHCLTCKLRYKTEKNFRPHLWGHIHVVNMVCSSCNVHREEGPVNLRQQCGLVENVIVSLKQNSAVKRLQQMVSQVDPASIKKTKKKQNIKPQPEVTNSTTSNADDACAPTVNAKIWTPHVEEQTQASESNDDNTQNEELVTPSSSSTVAAKQKGTEDSESNSMSQKDCQKGAINQAEAVTVEEATPMSMTELIWHTSYKCRDCGKSYPLNGSILLSHLRNCHRGPYTCLYCERSFDNARYLVTHLVNHSK
ncbi:unnamed protein product, partial [Owenia fusiformis]